MKENNDERSQLSRVILFVSRAAPLVRGRGSRSNFGIAVKITRPRLKSVLLCHLTTVTEVAGDEPRFCGRGRHRDAESSVINRAANGRCFSVAVLTFILDQVTVAMKQKTQFREFLQTY